MRPGPIEIIIVIFLALVVIGLITRRSKVARWIMGSIAVVLLLLVASLFLSRASHVIVLKQGDTTGHVYTPPYLSQPAASVQPSVTPAVWSSGLQDQFHADNYPSMQAAAKALGLQLANTIPSIVPQNDTPPLLRIYATGVHPPDLPNLQSIAAELRKLNRIEEVLVETPRPSHQPPVPPAPPGITIHVSLLQLVTRHEILNGKLRRQASPGHDFFSGAISAQVSASGGEFTKTVQFITKPWVENFSAYINNNPQGRWILARSQTSCTSPGEAHQQALRNAANQLFIGHDPANHPAMVNPAEIENLGFIVDRFSQSFEGSAGPIWREALLINAAPGKIVQVTQMHGALVRAVRGRTARHIVSLVSLLVLICVVYAFLNAATKGYYTWVLRIGAVVVIIVGILVALTVIS